MAGASTGSVGPVRFDEISRSLIPAALLAAVFLLDFSQPSDVAFSVLYILPIVATLGLGRPRVTYLAFLVTSVATVAAAAIGLQPDHISSALTNRALGLLAQLVAAAAVIQQLAVQTGEIGAQVSPAQSRLHPLEQLGNMVEYLPEAMALLYLDGRIHSVNQTALRLLGLPLDQGCGRLWPTLFGQFQIHRPAAQMGAVPADLRSWPERGPDTIYCELRLTPKGTDGPLRLTLAGVLLRDPEGRAFGALVLVRDITAAIVREQHWENFVSMAAHELRAPLSTVRGYTQIAQSQATAGGDPIVSETLQKALRQVDRLNRMIGELLDVTRLQGGRLELNYTLADLATLLIDEVEQRRAVYPDREFVVSAIDLVPAVPVDVPRLQQVLTNLLDNAIKYSPDGGPIALQLRLVGEMAEISVTDQGIGIPEKEHARLFEQFYRCEGSTKRVSGLGMGLYISEQIILRHGGRLSVQSAPGQGSTFTCSLPLMQRSAVA